MTFDGNSYRKRVLAAVAKRGGPESSDAFELYDISVEDAERITDTDVAAQIAEVWAFWQRQRDHPKYGTLVGLLVESHDERSAPLFDRQRRTSLAVRIRAERTRRDEDRFELLDQAIRRLVDRHRGVPRDKIDGLVEVGGLSGLTPEQVHARLRHHRIVDAAPVAAPATERTAPAVSDHRRQQVRDLLDEFGRLQEVPPPPTLLALLGLEPDATPVEVQLRAEAWRARSRELPPTRVRAVVDELLVHVRELLESGRDVFEGYLDVVAQDVAERLRPRVRAAVLVEDRLVADDHEHLVTEATALGLDWTRARQVIAAIATDMGVEVEPFGATAPPRREPAPTAASRAWEEPLRAARAALRAGRLVEARRLAAAAHAKVDAAGATPVRAVVDEIETAMREAELRWRAAATAIGARRFSEAVEHLEQLCRTAADVPSPGGAGRADLELERARREVAAADELVAAAHTSPDPAGALLAVLERWPGHPAAIAALAAIPLLPPSGVRAARDRTGAVIVTWQASATAGVAYRVTRLLPDGTSRVVGRTPACLVEDGGAGSSGPLPNYAVVAVRAGESSTEARTGLAPAPPPPVPAPAPRVTAPPRPSRTIEAPTGVVATRTRDGAVHVRWSGPTGAEFKISRQTADGRWQVVGRTRATTIEDGGAPTSGPSPVYSVVAARDGAVSAEALSG